MAVRTTSVAVQTVLNPNDYDATRSLDAYIETASAIVDQVVTCAASKGITINAELIERWLAAHMYQMSDPGYTSRSTANKSGSFRGTTTNKFDATLYGQTAQNVDVSGCLTAIGLRQVASIFWGGKTDGDKQTYEERNGV